MRLVQPGGIDELVFGCVWFTHPAAPNRLRHDVPSHGSAELPRATGVAGDKGLRNPQAEMGGTIKLLRLVGRLVDRERMTVIRQPFLLVEGVLQHQDGVLSVKAERVQGIAGGASVDAHDFY